jgi:hypothetical protein
MAKLTDFMVIFERTKHSEIDQFLTFLPHENGTIFHGGKIEHNPVSFFPLSRTKLFFMGDIFDHKKKATLLPLL